MTIADDSDTGTDDEIAVTFTADSSANQFGFDAGVEYDLGVFTLGGTAAYGLALSSGKSSVKVDGTTVGTYTYDNYMLNQIRGELYAKKGFSNGYIFAGVKDVVSIYNMTEKYTVLGSSVKDTSTNVCNDFSIPVGAEYWF